MEINNTLKELRKSKKKTQQQIADLLNITQATYSNYENGTTQAPYEILVKLSNIFNTSVDHILGKVEQQKSIDSSDINNSEQQTDNIIILPRLKKGVDVEKVKQSINDLLKNFEE